MLRRTLALATVVVLSITLIGDRDAFAGVQQSIASESSALDFGDPQAQLLEAPSEVAEAPVETVASTTAAPVEPSAPAPVQAPAPVAAPAKVAAAPVVAPPAVPATCPANWFCYPRVGIAGPIVPYTDCSAATDVGTSIRAITCVSPTYLAAHAYTQFGRITGWQAGDIVFAYGVRYTLYDGFTQGSCVAPARAIAALSLQTSLSPNNCGPVLVLQGRPG